MDDATDKFRPLRLYYTSELTKRYTLECMNMDILNATVDKSSLPTQVIAEAGELNRQVR